MHRRRANVRLCRYNVTMCKFLTCLLLAVLPALAQSEAAFATLSGTVTDPSGAAIANAKVTLVNQETGLSRNTATSVAGLYSFSSTPAGVYDLTVESAGFKLSRAAGVVLHVGAVATSDVRLEVGATSETVNVSADVAIVESTRSQTSTTIATQQVRDLPINGRNFLDFTILTPGVVRDQTRSGDLSFGGQRGTGNSLLVDGADANNIFFGQTVGRTGTGSNPYSFSQDSVQEFQVNTNTYAAEIGRAGGGVINVITKSGTNAFHGDAFEFYRDKALNANSWENNRRGLAKRAYHFNQFGGDIGGPVRRDKMYFFFDYDGQRNTTPNTVFLQVAPPSDALSQQAYQTLLPFLGSYANSLNNNVYLGKVDWNFRDNQRITFRYNANRFQGLNYENAGVASAVGHTGNSNVTTDGLVINHTLIVGTRGVLETRYGFTRDDEPGFANSTAPEAVIRQSGVTVLSIGRNNFSPRYTNVKTNQFASSYSYVKGAHSIKFGGDINVQKVGNYFPGNFSGSFTFNSYADFASSTPFSFTQAFAGAGTNGPLSKPNANEYALFAQDSWRITPRLTVNYGVRYDFYQYAQPSVLNQDPGLLAANLNTSRINRDKNNIGPRFGFAYKVNDKGSWVLRGGYGIYYGRTPVILTGTSFTQNGIQVQTYTLLAPNAQIPTYPNILSAPPALNRTPDIYVFAHNYVQPMTSQWSFNSEHQLGKDYSVTVGYLGVRGEHLTRSRDINLFPPQLVSGTLSGQPIQYLRYNGTGTLVRPNPAFGRITVFDSGANSIYHGGFIQLNKRLSRDFLVQTSYTFSKVIDDRPDFTQVVVGTDDSKQVFYPTLPGLDRGRGNSDITHRFVFSGVWDIDYAKSWSNPVSRSIFRGFQFSSIAQVQSGRTFNASVSGDSNNDGVTANERPPFVGRNTIIGPNFMQVDTRLSKDIVFAERVRLRLIFEAFNLTNRANFATINTTQYLYTAATRTFTPNNTGATPFLSRTTTFDPRILQLAAKVTF